MKEHLIQFIAISLGTFIARYGIVLFSKKEVIFSEIIIASIMVGIIATILRAIIYHNFPNVFKEDTEEKKNQKEKK